MCHPVVAKVSLLAQFCSGVDAYRGSHFGRRLMPSSCSTSTKIQTSIATPTALIWDTPKDTPFSKTVTPEVLPPRDKRGPGGDIRPPGITEPSSKGDDRASAPALGRPVASSMSLGQRETQRRASLRYRVRYHAADRKRITGTMVRWNSHSIGSTKRKGVRSAHPAPRQPASFHLHLLEPTWSANCIRKSLPFDRHFALNATRFLIVVPATIFKQCSAYRA